MADIMLSLQQEGAHNINFVSPTHVVPQILEALCMACGRGLNIPLVYNTGGYDAAETIKELSGIFDIYLPDMKYSDSGNAEKYSDAPDYPDQCFSSVREMHRQAGILETDSLGVAQRGLMVRHLVLPSGLAGSRRTLDFIAGELSASTYVNIMDQYHPCCRASDFPELRRRISPEEYENVVAYARKIGLARLEA
jgi:putative pyruvate formate lyase activating enzyme